MIYAKEYFMRLLKNSIFNVIAALRQFILCDVEGLRINFSRNPLARISTGFLTEFILSEAEGFEMTIHSIQVSIKNGSHF